MPSLRFPCLPSSGRSSTDPQIIALEMVDFYPVNPAMAVQSWTYYYWLYFQGYYFQGYGCADFAYGHAQILREACADFAHLVLLGLAVNRAISVGLLR